MNSFFLQTSPSVESEGEAGTDPQHDLQNMYQPEYYACYGKVDAVGGPLDIQKIQYIKGISPDQRPIGMHMVLHREEFLLAGTGGLLGSVKMLSSNSPFGYSFAIFKYICGNIFDLMLDKCPSAPHSFDSTVITAASCASSSLFASGDSAGCIGIWQLKSDELSGEYEVVSTHTLSSSIEHIFISPCGTLFCVAISRCLYLLALSHTRHDIRSGMMIGFGSLYVRAVLDIEPHWTVRTSYNCEFITPKYFDRNLDAVNLENKISIWKCAVDSSLPSVLHTSHWLHPNVECPEFAYRCQFRYLRCIFFIADIRLTLF